MIRASRRCTKGIGMIEIQIVGHKYNMLTVKAKLRKKNPSGKHMFLCSCDCGKETIVSKENLRSGHTRSCGCIVIEAIRRANKTHGGYRSPEYRIWQKIKERCQSETAKNFADYGGRGIKLCSRWQNFSAFREDMGSRPSSKHSIDRINNDGNYEPGNCRWATKTQQIRNRRVTLFLTFNGKTRPLIEWCEEHNKDYYLVRKRIRRGWTARDAILTEPKQNNGN